MTRTNDSQPTDPGENTDPIENTPTAETEALDSHSTLSYDAQATVPYDSNATVPVNDVPRNDAPASWQTAASTGYATPNAPFDPVTSRKPAWYRKPVLIGSVAAAVLLLGGAGIGFGIGANVVSNAELASNNSSTSDGPGDMARDESAPGSGHSPGEGGPGVDGPGRGGPRGTDDGTLPVAPVAPTDAPTDAPTAPAT